jgi:hypothetical protein
MTEKEEDKKNFDVNGMKVILEDFINEKINEEERKNNLTDEQYKEELKDEFIESLKNGVMISRRAFDIYTVQDNDSGWKAPRHVIRLKLNDDGKLEFMKGWCDKEEDILEDNDTPPLVE